MALLLLFGSMAGFALTQLRFRGSSALFLVCLAALFIPFQVIMVPLAGSWPTAVSSTPTRG